MVRAVLLLTALLLAGCGEGRISAAEDITGEWELAEGTADGAALPSSGATLQLGNGEAGGVWFCNHYFGTYRLTGAAIVFEGLGGTEMACEPDVMVAERAYLYALGTVGTPRRSGPMTWCSPGTTSGSGSPPWHRCPTAPREHPVGAGDARPGRGRLLDARRARPPAAHPDRRASAPTGCRSITGTWLVENGMLIIDVLLADGGECPADVQAQDALVAGVLGAGPRVAIAENRLTLTVDDGRGLVYRAGP